MKKTFWFYIATWFGSGLSPVASGTAGSLAALPFAWLIQVYLGSIALFFAAVAIFFVGWWASKEYLRHHSSPIRGEAGWGANGHDNVPPRPHPNPPPTGEGKEGDPGEIVVDEVAAQWLVLSCIGGLFPMGVSYLVGFLLFRLFDIIKIWPASWADEKVHGPLGVMLDDVFAALQAVLVVWFFYLLTHG